LVSKVVLQTGLLPWSKIVQTEQFTGNTGRPYLGSEEGTLWYNRKLVEFFWCFIFLSFFFFNCSITRWLTCTCFEGSTWRIFLL